MSMVAVTCYVLFQVVGVCWQVMLCFLLHPFVVCRCQVFDKNSDGYIDEQELQQTMKELGVTLTSDDVTAMFTEAGCKDQRRITYEGFWFSFSTFTFTTTVLRHFSDGNKTKMLRSRPRTRQKL